jgi:hypothetical protein
MINISLAQFVKVAHTGWDVFRELDVIERISDLVTDPHRFAIAYEDHVWTARGFSQDPMPPSKFYDLWPHKGPAYV